MNRLIGCGVPDDLSLNRPNKFTTSQSSKLSEQWCSEDKNGTKVALAKKSPDHLPKHKRRAPEPPSDTKPTERLANTSKEENDPSFETIVGALAGIQSDDESDGDDAVPEDDSGEEEEEEEDAEKQNHQNSLDRLQLDLPQDSKDHSQNSQVRLQNSQVRLQNSQVRSQNSQVRLQNSQVRSQNLQVAGKTGGFWVYLLESCASPHFSYVGFTVNRERRLRQHNGELKCGGAKYTKNHRPWRMVMSISCDNSESTDNSWWNKISALQLEWRCKHVSKGRSRRRRPRMGNLEMQRWKTIRVLNRPAVERRLNDIFWLLHNRKKWTPNAPEWTPGRSLRIEMHPSLITPEIQKFAQHCSFWQPKIHPLLNPEKTQ
jgi:predicted GIY-YIG superfamily endonuclease